MVVGEDIILPRSYRSPPHIRLLSLLLVGTDVLDCPSSLRSQNTLPSVAKTNDIHLTGRGRRPRRPFCLGFAQNILKRVILSEQRVASRTFGFANDNIVSKSKSENRFAIFGIYFDLYCAFDFKVTFCVVLGLNIIFL